MVLVHGEGMCRVECCARRLDVMHYTMSRERNGTIRSVRWEKIRKLFIKVLTGILLFPVPELRRSVRVGLHYGGLITDTFWRYPFIRKNKTYKYYLSLAICIRDEAAYIAEWLEYHRLLGVEHFYIYDNDSTDHVETVLAPYIRIGIVTCIPYSGEGVQTLMYRDALLRFRHETRWMGILDCDEFIFPCGQLSLLAFLRGCEGYSQILLHWLEYGSSGHRYREPGLVIERFRKHAASPSPLTKVIVNPRAVTCAGIHFCRVLGPCTNETRQPIDLLAYSRAGRKSADVMRVNHYVVKSREEFLLKRKRGLATPSDKSNDEHYSDTFFRIRDANEIEDPPELMRETAATIHRRLSEKSQLSPGKGRTEVE